MSVCYLTVSVYCSNKKIINAKPNQLNQTPSLSRRRNILRIQQEKYALKIRFFCMTTSQEIQIQLYSLTASVSFWDSIELHQIFFISEKIFFYWLDLRTWERCLWYDVLLCSKCRIIWIAKKTLVCNIFCIHVLLLTRVLLWRYVWHRYILYKHIR